MNNEQNRTAFDEWFRDEMKSAARSNLTEFAWATWQAAQQAQPSRKNFDAFINAAKEAGITALLINAQPAPKGWRDRLEEMRGAAHSYEDQPELFYVILDSVHEMLTELEKESVDAQQEQPRCKTCGGNDGDMPCAYPSAGMSGCLRDARLAQPAKPNYCLLIDELISSWLTKGNGPDEVARRLKARAALGAALTVKEQRNG